MNRDLGYGETDRTENVRRAAEVAKLFLNEGCIALVALISPLSRQRATARALFRADEFIEIFVDAPLAVCEARDPKGLYRRARAREIQDFTGVDAVYESPVNPELHLRTDREPPSTLVRSIVDYLEASQILWRP